MIIIDPNIVAYLAVLSSPVIFFVFFQVFPPALATALTLIGGYMFLPIAPRIDLPIIPPLDKETIPIACAMIFGTLAISRQRNQRSLYNAMRRSGGTLKAERFDALPGWMPRNWVARILILMVPVTAFLSGMANQAPVFLEAGRVLPGYTIYSVLSHMMITSLIVLPILVGRRIFAHPDAQKTLLAVIAIGAAGYSLLGLVELRLSPQLNNWIYGFFPHRFDQHMRAGGFRPVVFMQHGLWYALLLCMGALAAIGLSRCKDTALSPAAWAGMGIWTFLVLTISNSLGAFILAFLFLPVVAFMPTRLQLTMAAMVGLMVLSFPIIRERGLIPTNAFVEAAASVSAERAQSLAFRFQNEDEMLAHVQQKLSTGWGSFGRNLLYHERTGEPISVTDGYWILVLGIGGMLRYIVEYGLLTIAFWVLLFRSKRLSLGPETAVVATLLAVNLIDMIPNATNTVITGLLAGALLGRLEVAADTELQGETDNAMQKRGGRHRRRTGAQTAEPSGPALPAGAVASAEGAAALAESGGSRYSRYGPAHMRQDEEEPTTRRKRRF